MQYVIIPHRDDRVCLIHGGQTGRRHPLGKDELMHYRTPGSRNGVRLYQNKDGSLTPLGRRHYGIEHPLEWYKTHGNSEEAQAQARKAAPDYHAMNRAGQAMADQMARRAQREYEQRAAQTPKVKPASTAQASKPSTQAQNQAVKPAAPAANQVQNQNAKPAAQAANQGQRPTKQQMIEQAVSEHRSAPSQPITAQRANEIREITREHRSAAPGSTGTSGGSLYNLDGTKKMEKSVPQAQQAPQPAASEGKPQTTQEWIDYIKAHPGQGPGNTSNGVGKAIENAVNGVTKGAADLWNNTVVPTAQNVSNAVTGGLNDAGAYIQGLTGNQAEVRRQQDMQRTGMPNNAAAAVAGQQMNQNINNAAQGAGGFFDRAGQWIGNAANDVGNWVGNAANDVGKAVTGAVNGAGQWVGNAANDVGNAVNGAGQRLNQAGNDVSNRVGNVANDVLNAAVQALNEPFHRVQDVANGVGEAVGNAANAVGKFVDDAAQGASTGLAQGYNWAKNAVNDVGQFAGDTYRNAQNWVNNEAVPAVNRAVQNAEQFVNQTVVPGAQTAAQNTGNWLQNAWNGVTNWVGNAANDVGKAVTGAMNDAGQWIGNAANDVGKAVTGAVNGAGQWINNAANDVGNWVGNAVNDVGQFAQGAYNGLTRGQYIPVQYANTNSNQDPDVRNGFNAGNAVRQAVDNAGQWIGNAANDVGKAVTGAVNGAGQWINNAANDVGNAVTGAVQNAGQGISDLWNRGVVPTAANVGNNVSGFVQGALGNVSPEELRLQQHLQRGGAPNNVAAIQAGQGLNNTVTGAVNGAKDIWNNNVVPTAQNAWNTVTGAVQNAGNAAKDVINNQVVPAAYGAASNAGLAPNTFGNVPGGAPVNARPRNISGSANPLAGLQTMANNGNSRAQEALGSLQYYINNPSAPMDYSTYQRLLSLGVDAKNFVSNPIMNDPYGKHSWQTLQSR